MNWNDITLAQLGFDSNSSKDKWDGRFMKLAQEVATWSKDPSTQIGSVIARGKRFISLGYNGFPAGMPDLPELYASREEKYSRIIHGEMNALAHAGQAVMGCTLYTVPFASCDRCAVFMIEAGIMRFVFPKLDGERQERWGAAVDKSKKYIEECGRWWEEIEVANG